MTVVTLPYRTQLTAGKDEDVGMVLADLDAIVAAVNGNLENDNVNAAAAIAFSKVAISGTPNGARFLNSVTRGWADLPTGTGLVKHMKATAKDVVNTTTKTDLFNAEITLAAAEATESDCVFIWCGGDYLNNSGGNRTLRMTLDIAGNSAWDSDVSDNIPQNAARRSWNFIGVIQGGGAGSGKVAVGGVFSLGGISAPTTGIGALRADVTNFGGLPLSQGSQTFTLTSTGAITLTAQHGSASANLSMRLLRAAVITMTSN